MTTTTLDYQLPTTLPGSTGSLWRLGLASIVVALLTLPLPVNVLFDMNRECVAVVSRGYERPAPYPLAEPRHLPVSREAYLRVRTAVAASVLGPLTLLAAGVAAVRSRAWGVRLHVAYVAVQLAVGVPLVTAARAFAAELDALTRSRYDWFAGPGPSSVGDTALRMAILSLAYALVLGAVFRGPLARPLAPVGRWLARGGRAWHAAWRKRRPSRRVYQAVFVPLAFVAAMALIVGALAACSFVMWLIRG